MATELKDGNEWTEAEQKNFDEAMDSLMQYHNEVAVYNERIFRAIKSVKGKKVLQ